jgi:hypothetical protein
LLTEFSYRDSRLVSEIDYKDDVVLMGYETGKISPATTITTVLSEAVRIVIEEWPSVLDPSIYSARGGDPLRGREIVRRIYDRDDFPRETT